jgi:predicted protein tyrosine phosphatase
MSHILVCSLAAVDTEVARHGASHLVTLLSPGSEGPAAAAITADRRLYLEVNDIDQPMEGLVAPDEDTVDRLLSFTERWPAQAPLLIHCWAGISRSTAAAFVVACARNPHTPEPTIAQALRDASPTAYPNRRIVAFADARLGREGRMIAAIAALSPPQLADAAQTFALPVRF